MARAGDGGDRERRADLRGGRRHAAEDRAYAAHESGDRPNAPLLTYLVGRAHGERSLTELLEAVRIELVSNSAFAYLHPTGSHPESQQRLVVLHERFPFVECAPASGRDVLRCHSPELVELVRDTRGWIDADTICSDTTYEAALLAAGAAIDAVRRAASHLRVRPATTPSANGRWDSVSSTTIAIAARWAQAELGLERVAIVDWDVHHGNGTQDVVAGDETILFISLHQWPLYPGTGGPDEQGPNLINIPLPAGTGRRRVPRSVGDRRASGGRIRPGPAARLGRVRRTRRRPARQHGTELGRFPRPGPPRATQLAPRVAAVLEGGYNLETLPDLVEAALEGFTD